jgi:hypothetical protein
MDGMEDLAAGGEASTEDMEQAADVAVASLQDMAEEPRWSGWSTPS